MSGRCDEEEERGRNTKSTGASKPHPPAGGNRFAVGFARAGGTDEGLKSEARDGFGWYGEGERRSNAN